MPSARTSNRRWTRARRPQGVGLRVESDWSENRPGWKRSEWELRGVPLRLEVGPRDLAAGEVRVVRRDTREAQQVPVADLATAIPALLDQIQDALAGEGPRDAGEQDRPG
jgi:prolyl-tRNA synthetase